MNVLTPRMVRIDLAIEADFRLGPAIVSPSTRQLRCGRAQTTLEPRVMQLLVALARAQGQVVSRDELVLRCWDGLVVGDNAINRVVSLLRTAAVQTCDGAFEIETIKKVGYRIVVRTGAEPAEGSAERPASRRRWVLGASAALGVGVLSGGALWWRGRSQPLSVAQELVSRGRIAQRQGLLDQTEQAIAFFSEAVRLEPANSEAWGALALSYRHKLTDDPSANVPELRRRLDDAAARALAVDPQNADAHVARLLSVPTFGRWRAREQAFRAAQARFPDHWLLRGSLGRLMYDVGRWSVGVPLFQANVAQDPFLPVSRISLGQGLWALGRVQEAEQVYREALDRWPKHARVWMASFSFLALSGQPDAALALATGKARRPVGLPEPVVERNMMWARALSEPRPGRTSAALAALSEQLAANPDAVPGVAPVLTLLGDADAAMAAIQLYFSPPRPATTPSGQAPRPDWRSTDFLFSPPLAALRSDRRFNGILRTVGLVDYWRETGSRPDPAAL